MDVQRSSALPRPLSKLPMPRSFATGIPKPPSPELRPEFEEPHTQGHSSKLSSESMSTTSTHRSSTSSVTSHSSSRPPTAHKTATELSGLPAPPGNRLPLRPPQRPQSKQGSNHQPPFFHDTVEARSSQAYSKATRNTSQQENVLELYDSPEESDNSSNSVTSPVRALKKAPRPSLSDRTVDSLSQMSPVSARRSSFFNPQSPMASPIKSPTATNRGALVAAVDTSQPQQPTYSKVTSPSKPPTSRIGIPSTPSQKATGSSLPRTGLPTVGKVPTTTHKRSMSAVKTLGRPNSAAGTNPTPSKIGMNSNRPAAGSRYSMIAPPKTALQGPPASKSTTPFQRPQPPQLQKPKRPISSFEPLKGADIGAAPAPRPERVTNRSATRTDSPTSSATLRGQIAQAKLAHRKNVINATAQPTSSYRFEECDDPFNQKSHQNKTPLEKRIDDARQDGRLNVAALGLKDIPAEVLHMYDAEAMQSSSVPWNETVDLVRFNAADNEISEISEDTFPDLSIEELSQGAEAKFGNQFGGINNLDLHGNQLSKVPMGLRRLEHLTSLNLSRNKLDNGVFEVIFQVSSLKELRLAENDLSREVPETLSRLANLEVLDLHKNKLSVVPKTIRDLMNLRILNLSENRFAELPLGSLFSLPQLSELYAATNALTGAFFPGTVEIVRNLQTLDVSNNSLAALSFSTDLHLPALQYMNVSSNRLFAFPDISSWTSLIRLLAEENGLTALPPGFTTLKDLKVGDFSRNSLRAVDVDVGKMEMLETLNVAANPLREKKLLNMSTNEIKKDLAKRLEAPPA